jgi:hypothetical protein
MMHTKIHTKTIGCKRMSGFIILDVTPICYVQAQDKKTSHDAHLSNKLGNERNNFDYSFEEIFH